MARVRDLVGKAEFRKFHLQTPIEFARMQQSADEETKEATDLAKKLLRKTSSGGSTRWDEALRGIQNVEEERQERVKASDKERRSFRGDAINFERKQQAPAREPLKEESSKPCESENEQMPLNDDSNGEKKKFGLAFVIIILALALLWRKNRQKLH